MALFSLLLIIFLVNELVRKLIKVLHVHGSGVHFAQVWGIVIHHTKLNHAHKNHSNGKINNSNMQARVNDLISNEF